jgi:hypothetical protein
LVKQAQDTHNSGKESIKRTPSDRNELKYIVELVVTTKGVVNCVKLN